MAQIIVPSRPPEPFRINNFAGINKAVTPTQIADNESPNMLNLQLDERGLPDKRPGYAKLFVTSLGAGKTNGLHRFKKTDGTKIFLIHHGTKLYTQTGSAQPVQIFSGMANQSSKTFMFNNKMYIMDGTNYLVYDGVTVVDVSTVAYVPTLRIAVPPAGGGSANEDFNLLTPAFKMSFSADGAATVFKLGITNLDATPLTAVVNNVNMNKGAGFTVNRTTGDVTFTVAPVTGVPDNVVITAFKTTAVDFNTSFSADGTTTVFKLGVTNLDATPLTAVVNGVNKVETTDFTVNRVTGDVTFIAAPATGAPNNVVITAHKTTRGFANRIKQCKFFVLYGGTNDTRVFVSGNPNFPNQLWRCGVYDPTYFGENKFQKVGSDASAITGFAKQFSSLLIYKEPAPTDNVVWSTNYTLAADGITATFPVMPLNDDVGCSATDSIQLIENTPTYLNATKGVYFIVGSNVRDERNVQHISDKVDLLLLSETGLASAVSVDYDKKYILVVGNKAYVYDYRQNVWYLWSNIPASCFIEIDGILYFGSNSTGMVYQFKKGKDANGNILSTDFNDDGAAILGHWESKVFSFNNAEHLKMVEKLFYSLKPATQTSVDLYYLTDRTEKTFVRTDRMDTFDYTTFNYINFSYLMSFMPQEIAAKIRAKKIIDFQIILENNIVNESMGILSIGIKYHTQREVR